MRKLFLFVLLWGSCVRSIAQVNSYADHARLEDFAGKLIGGTDRLQRKMDEFTKRTGLDIYIITAYKYNQPDISRLATTWPQQGKGLLLGLNLHEEDNWSGNLQIAYTPEVTDKIPAEKIGQVRNLVLLPLLEGREITVTDAFGGTTKVAFGGQGKYYLTLEQGIAALLAAFDGTPLGAVPAIAFMQGTDSRYGFDAKSKDRLDAYYQKGTNEFTGKDEFIPWKAVETGKTDLVEVVSSGKSNKAELAKVKFNTSTGSISASPLADNRLQLSLQGASWEDTEELTAYYPTSDSSGYTIARLNVVTYPKLPKNVVIVPLKGTNGVPKAEEIKPVLNKIYGQAVAEWEVEVGPVFDPGAWDSNANGKVEIGNSGLLSNYTGEMRIINRAFKNNYAAFDKDTYYLFLVNEAESAATLGYMPRAKQFGYVFTKGQTQQGIIRTIAHELGHGAFHLKHTFEETNVAKGSSTNVMDYPSGTTLNKYQWDLVHDPARVIGLLEEDEEAALSGSWTILDEKYTLLFNHVYDNNHVGNLTYSDKIFNAKSSGETNLDLDYTGIAEEEWINQWKLRTSTSDRILEKIIKKIKDTGKGGKIPSMSLSEKGIYLGLYTYEEVAYPIAIYCEKATISNLKKIQIQLVGELIEPNNSKHLKCEETFIKYLVVAFYEEGSSQPALIMQVEKFDISKWQNTKEQWLKFLNILVPGQEEQLVKEDGKEEVKKEVKKEELIVKAEDIVAEAVKDESLIDGKLHLIVMSEKDTVRKDSFLIISSTPEMPKVKAKLFCNDSELNNKEVEFKLKIEYSRSCQCEGWASNTTTCHLRDRRDVDWFPSSGWQKKKVNEEWNIDFGDRIRGGRASFIYKHNIDEEVVDTLLFNIRGENPTVQQLITFINSVNTDNVWFLKKIIFHESGTPNNLNARAKQFNIYNKNRHGSGWDKWSQCPNFGPPCGWGLMQLDVLNDGAPRAQALWDWRANVRRAYDLIMQSKRQVVINHLNNEIKKIENWNKIRPDEPVVGHEAFTDGGVTYTHSRSQYVENSRINSHFVDLPTGNNRSFIDACIIKTYNGVPKNHYYYLMPSKDGNPPVWQVEDWAKWANNTNYYVRAVGNQQTP